MADEPRPASSPGSGAVRDAVRTFVALALTGLLVNAGFCQAGEECPVASQVGVAVAGVVVMGFSALMAYIGKKSRDNSSGFLGKIF